MNDILAAAAGDSRAVKRLLARPDAAERIMDFLKGARDPGALGPVLVEACSEASIEGLKALWNRGGNLRVQRIAARALARIRAPEVVPILAEGLNDRRRRTAISALGDTCLEAAEPALGLAVSRITESCGVDLARPVIESLGSEVDPSELEMLPSALAALAKVGARDRRFSVLFGLLTFQSDDPYVSAVAVRNQASKALQVVVMDHMVEQLAAAMERESSEEVLTSGVDALFYLGRPVIVELFFEWADGYGALAKAAEYRLRDLIGPLGGAEPTRSELRDRWQMMLVSEGAQDCCYRGGAPLSPDVFLEALQNHGRRVAVLQELLTISGEWLGYDEYFGEVAWFDYETAVRRWVHRQKNRFPNGSLYKYGRPVLVL